MLVEVSVAVNYILSHLYTKLPRRRVDSFGEELERYLIAKFQHHWFPNDPLRDASFRCLNCSGPQVDLLLPEAAAVSGLDWSEIQACLPEGLVLSIDPGHVACRHNQTNNTINDMNRFAASNLWPSAPLSLSSSGCSSASSSISSSNPTSNTAQVTHQVLYNSQDGWGSCSNYLWNEQQKDPVPNAAALSKTVRLDDHGDNLATAAALSVLIDPDEGIDTRLSQEILHGGSPALTNQTPWNNNATGLVSPGNRNDHSRAFADLDLKHIEYLKGEMLNGCDNTTMANQVPWAIAEDMNDNSLLNILGCDLNGTSGVQPSLFSQRTQTFPGFHRSSSNPPQSEQLSGLSLGDYVPVQSGQLNGGSSIAPNLAPKLDQSLNSVLTSNHQTRPFPNYLQPVPVLTTASNHPFVQKSTSTPSFTAATFAQTKFGSTKLKTHTKRTPTRILSPTTVQPSFTSVNGNGIVPNECNAAAVTGTNQRINTTNPNSISAFRRFLPLSVDLNTHKPNGCSNPTDSVFQSECNSFKHPDNGHSPSDITMPAFQMRPLQMNGLEDYLTHTNDDPVGSDIFARFGSTDDHSNPHVTNLWNSFNVNRQVPDDNAVQESVETTHSRPCPSWSDGLMGSTVHGNGFNNTILANNNSITNLNLDAIKTSRLGLNSQSSGLKLEDHTDGLLDDATLSTRMVNLLLEEDSSIESSTNATHPSKLNLLDDEQDQSGISLDFSHPLPSASAAAADLKSLTQSELYSNKDLNVDIGAMGKTNLVQLDSVHPGNTITTTTTAAAATSNSSNNDLILNNTNNSSNHSLATLIGSDSFGSFA